MIIEILELGWSNQKLDNNEVTKLRVIIKVMK